jgi:hypothetical protein
MHPPLSHTTFRSLPCQVGPSHRLWRLISHPIVPHGPQVGPSLCLASRIGPMHTAAAYTNLTSLLLEKREALIGKSIAVFSYGSGAASTMYRLQVRSRGKPGLSTLNPISEPPAPTMGCVTNCTQTAVSACGHSAQPRPPPSARFILPL